MVAAHSGDLAAAAATSVISPLRCRISHGTPCAFIAGSSGSSRARPARDLLQRARAQHRVEARIDPRIELVAIGREKQRAELSRHRSSGGRPSRCQSVSERPVASTTSSARAMRVRSRGFSRSDRAGSRRAARHAAPRRRRVPAARARPSRISGGIGGTADSPRVSALKYSPEPPTKIGRRPARAPPPAPPRHRPPSARRKFTAASTWP
jgi:hypothetical protein